MNCIHANACGGEINVLRYKNKFKGRKELTKCMPGNITGRTRNYHWRELQSALRNTGNMLEIVFA